MYLQSSARGTKDLSSAILISTSFALFSWALAFKKDFTSATVFFFLKKKQEIYYYDFQEKNNLVYNLLTCFWQAMEHLEYF